MAKKLTKGHRDNQWQSQEEDPELLDRSSVHFLLPFIASPLPLFVWHWRAGNISCWPFALRDCTRNNPLPSLPHASSSLFPILSRASALANSETKRSFCSKSSARANRS